MIHWDALTKAYRRFGVGLAREASREAVMADFPVDSTPWIVSVRQGAADGFLLSDTNSKRLGRGETHVEQCCEGVNLAVAARVGLQDGS